jgi:hypothetical protein
MKPTDANKLLKDYIIYIVCLQLVSATLLLGSKIHYYSLLMSVRVPHYQPLAHNSFPLAIIFKFVAAKILVRLWKQMIIARSQINITQCTVFFSWEITRYKPSYTQTVDALCVNTVGSPLRGKRVVDFALPNPSFLTLQGLVVTICTSKFNIHLLLTVLCAFFADLRTATMSVRVIKW